MVGLKRARETVSDAAGKITAAAADTRQVVIAIAAVAALALCVALVALTIAFRARKGSYATAA